MADVINRFPQEFHKFQDEYQLLPESIDYFFQLLQQNYEINEDPNLTYIHCIDLLKISKYLKVRKLLYNIYQYINDHKENVDFIIQMIQYELQNTKEVIEHSMNISKDIEHVLTSKINECLSNSKFKELPIQIIHRVISKSSMDSINSNKLFDIIINCIRKYCVLFQFLDLQKLSEDRLDDLCEIYSNSDENTHQYFNYLKCNLNLIREINKRKKNVEETNEEQKNKMIELESKVTSLQSQLINSNELNNQHENKTKELESKVTSLQSKFTDSENQLNDSKELINIQQTKMKELENQISLLQDRLDEMFLIKGKITAKVENGLFICAEINLKEKNSSLDTSRSKFIISTSSEKSIGIEEYENGEPITSLNQKTSSYLCRPGTFFVRCIVFNSNGESNEIVSNPVTTSGSSAAFKYEGKPAKIILSKGQYKLEVWGAKGGNSKGGICGDRKSTSIDGGLGGYSSGILNLNKNETVYVYVGGEGCTANWPDGSDTKGGFPDGGGTKTGHCDATPEAVPGTGGGSTSIRIGSDTNYARVIVAGGGGGAGGLFDYADPGGFGGGLNGGNCSYKSQPRNQAGGTQIGSTGGFIDSGGVQGDPGQFGLGATGKYIKGRDSGGGGGGGWYGGGSGGVSTGNFCSSGGGGSGWTFTAARYNYWQSGDSENANKFTLDSSYYLTNDKCVGGNEEFPKPDGNGTEKGHSGNDYAKITPL